MFERPDVAILDFSGVVKEIKRLVRPYIGEAYYYYNWKPFIEEIVLCGLAGGFIFEEDIMPSLERFNLPSDIREEVFDIAFRHMDELLDMAFEETRETGIFTHKWTNPWLDTDLEMELAWVGDRRVEALKEQANESIFSGLAHGDYFPTHVHTRLRNPEKVTW